MQKNNVTDYVMQYIKAQITTGRWKVGDKISSENELCKEIGVSRTSVRSALQRYNVLGIIRSEKGRGAYVQSDKIGQFADQLNLTDNNVIDMAKYVEWRQARQMIEPEIAYKVASISTPELIKKLNKINQEQIKLDGNQDAYILKDAEFHIALAEFLDNKYILAIVKGFFKNIDMLRFGNETFGYFGGTHFHMLITDAIVKQDAKRAKNLMIEHGLVTDEIG